MTVVDRPERLLRIDEVQLKDRLADGMGRVCGHLEDFIRRGFTR